MCPLASPGRCCILQLSSSSDRLNLSRCIKYCDLLSLGVDGKMSVPNLDYLSAIGVLILLVGLLILSGVGGLGNPALVRYD